MRVKVLSGLFAAVVAAAAFYAQGDAVATTLAESGFEDLDSAATAGEQKRIGKLIAGHDYDQALKEAQALEQRQPRDAAVATLKGVVDIMRGDLANAHKAFERALALKPDSLAAAMNVMLADLQQNNVEAARERLKALLASRAADEDGTVDLSAIAMATGQDADYVAWLEKAAKANPANVRSRVLLVNYYVRKRDVARALALANDMRTASPDDPNVLATLGNVQLVAGDAASAVSTLTHLVNVVPENASAHYKLATAQMAVRNFPLARAEATRALALDPDMLQDRVLLGQVELAGARYSEALRVAAQIQSDYPRSAAGPTLEGDILMAQKDYAAARKAYEKAFQLEPVGVLATRVHAAQSAAGQPKEADERLQSWIASNPKDVQSRIYLANAELRSQQNKRAIEQYQQILALDPNNVLALNNLAWLLHQSNDPRAVGMAEHAYQMVPGDPQVIDTLAWILVDTGNTTRGLELLRRAAELAPASPTVQYHLAAALAKSGDNDQALRTLQNVLMRNPSFAQRADAEALLKQLKK